MTKRIGDKPPDFGITQGGEPTKKTKSLKGKAAGKVHDVATKLTKLTPGPIRRKLESKISVEPKTNYPIAEKPSKKTAKKIEALIEKTRGFSPEDKIIIKNALQDDPELRKELFDLYQTQDLPGVQSKCLEVLEKSDHSYLNTAFIKSLVIKIQTDSETGKTEPSEGLKKIYNDMLDRGMTKDTIRQNFISQEGISGKAQALFMKLIEGDKR